MKVLLVGGGGREHALGTKLADSPLCGELLSCPGNPGLAELGRVVDDIDISDPARVTNLAVGASVDLVVVGPEAPLAAGVADALGGHRIPVFGPTKAGARIESSKTYAKDIMAAAKVPTAESATFTRADDARKHLSSVASPYVVKADGLAAGKGVLVTESLTDATAWVDECLDGRFGSSDASVVIEEHMDGDEVSVFFLCGGGAAVPFEPARDYKRLNDGDLGPNTGGMGAYSPVDDLPDGLVAWTLDRVAHPTLAELSERGIDYTGFLYVGLMLTATGPRVVEFNARLGDPETEALMPRLSSDLLAAIVAAVAGDTNGMGLTWNDRATVNVVLAAEGYPSRPRSGDRITMTPSTNAVAYHAGTAIVDGHLVTAGGRVMNVVGIGTTIQEARVNAYRAADRVEFEGKYHRTDIGATREDTR
ncbi:MAG: phosphoribosylamine--glycine ligase [Acidimicrobiia bacterium]